MIKSKFEFFCSFIKIIPSTHEKHSQYLSDSQQPIVCFFDVKYSITFYHPVTTKRICCWFMCMQPQAFTKCVVTMNDDPKQPDKTTVAYDIQNFTLCYINLSN
jgi:hypothetical protein